MSFGEPLANAGVWLTKSRRPVIDARAEEGLPF